MPHHLRAQAAEAQARTRTSSCASRRHRPPTSVTRTHSFCPPQATAPDKWRVCVFGRQPCHSSGVLSPGMRHALACDRSNKRGIAAQREALWGGAVHPEVEVPAVRCQLPGRRCASATAGGRRASLARRLRGTQRSTPARPIWPSSQCGGMRGHDPVFRSRVFFFFFPFFSAAAPKVPVPWRSATGTAAPGRRSPPVGHATHGRAVGLLSQAGLQGRADCAVARLRIRLRHIWRDVAQIVVGPRAAAQEQQEPRALQVRKVRQVVQECLFISTCRPPHSRM